ncbi:MAG TPA: NADP-dependent oxidoreductase [Steroidobacteraceae bacterium]|nr:NADP-dependent oxidoreductase [Steroidobacteraceae bacterium]
MRLLQLAGAVAMTAALWQAASAAVPQSMRAAAIDAAGGAQALKLHTVPVPQLAVDEVLIAVDTADVAVWDVGVRAHPDELQHAHFPLVLGSDGSGVVAAVGAEVRGFKPGDAVYGYMWDNPKGGFYAEYVALPARQVGHLPPGMSLRDAGAIAASALTAIQGVDDTLHIKPGETLIIHAAGGGVGSLALQFARLRGARVLATASGEDGASFVKGLGADAVVDGRKGDITAAAHQFAASGVDAVLAFAGGESLQRCVAALKPGGRVAYPWGVTPEPKLTVDVRSSTVYNAIAGPEEFERLNQAIVAAKLRVTVAAEYPLAEAAAAHERLEAGHVLGKVVLRIH